MSKLASVVIDCTDPYVAVPFWSLALGPPCPPSAPTLPRCTTAA